MTAYLMHRCQFNAHSKATRRARPFPRHPPSSPLAARTVRHCRRSPSIIRQAQEPQEHVLPENVDLNDPELQAQITALLKELDPDLLLEDTQDLLATAAAASQGQQQQQQQQAPESDEPHVHQQQQQFAGAGSSSSSDQQATAWQEDDGDDETEAGLPEGVVLVRQFAHQCLLFAHTLECAGDRTFRCLFLGQPQHVQLSPKWRCNMHSCNVHVPVARMLAFC
ncbi:hypothetical protein COO60DRAFT_335706 [Scenedesmus sp. NREL 46B-D3]|nr:hypothetical protein COO60DRAFT_335706 [Scenedesmus sp. NREL 46B-D3]